MPPSATATLPTVSRTAPVNAPRAWPNNSLSSNSPDRLGQWTVTNGPLARGLRSWTARASKPLPVPLSPRSRSVASLPAAFSATSSACRMAGSAGLEVGLRHHGADLLLQLRHVRLQPRAHRATRSKTMRSWSGTNGLGR